MSRGRSNRLPSAKIWKKIVSKVVTTQKTSKFWKAWILTGWLMTVGGMLFLLVGSKFLGPYFTITGPMTYIMAKFGQWWHHK